MTKRTKRLLALMAAKPKLRRVSGAPPLTYKAKKAGTLTDYRIYGQTVDGESVGNLVTSGEHAGEYKVPVTVEGKNLLQNTATSQTINGVTFTVNDDGSVTCNTDENGATATTRFYLVGTGGIDFKKININANAIITGCPHGGNVNTYSLFILRTNDDMEPKYNTWADTGNGFNLPYNETNKYVIYINISTGTICDNLTFYPMIRNADITDDTYEPYQTPVTTNLYLPEQIRKVGDEAEYIDYGEQKQHRVRKNLLQNTATSQTHNGVTFTVNDDKSITCNGTSTSQYYSYIELPILLLPGQYRLSGCPLNGDTNTYRAELRVNGLTVNGSIDIGNGSIFTVSSETEGLYFIRIQGGYTVENKTFYPMIRKADIEDDTYEPYIENTDLDVTLPALPTVTGTNVLSVGTEVQPSLVEIEGRIKPVVTEV